MKKYALNSTIAYSLSHANGRFWINSITVFNDFFRLWFLSLGGYFIYDYETFII